MRKYIIVLVLLYFSLSKAVYASPVYSCFYDQSDSVHLNNVKKLPFKTIEKSINNGFKNGVYWLKIDLHTSALGEYYLEIPHAHVIDAQFYTKQLVEIPLTKKRRFVTFKFQHKKIKGVYYLRVNCTKEAAIPIRLAQSEDYVKRIHNCLLKLGGYYGIVLSVLVFHLFFYLNSGKKTYLYYTFMLISLTLTLGYRDGFLYYYLGDHWITRHVEPLFNWSIALAAVLFTHDYLQFNKYLPNYHRWGIVTLILPIFAYALYGINYNYFYFVLTENLIIFSLTVYYSACFFVYNKNLYAKFYAWAYGGMMVMCYMYYNSGFYGIDFLEISTNVFRIGGVFEMSVFTFAITYQSKILNKENRKLQLDLESKNKELTTFTMQFVEKNTALREVEEELNDLKSASIEDNKSLVKIKKNITRALGADNSWEEFKIRFESVNTDFYKHIKKEFPELSNAEIKLAALVKLKLSIKESAALLNNSERSVVSARSRLRKKFRLTKEDNLYDFIDKY